VVLNYTLRHAKIVKCRICVLCLVITYILPFFEKLTILSGLLSARFIVQFTVLQDRDLLVNVPPINLLLALRCATNVLASGAEGLVTLYAFCRGYDVV